MTVTGLLQPDDSQPTPPGAGVSRIVRPERVPVRTVCSSDAVDFTPWLGSNLDFLDELGLGQLSWRWRRSFPDLAPV